MNNVICEKLIRHRFMAQLGPSNRYFVHFQRQANNPIDYILFGTIFYQSYS